MDHLPEQVNEATACIERTVVKPESGSMVRTHTSPHTAPFKLALEMIDDGAMT